VTAAEEQRARKKIKIALSDDEDESVEGDEVLDLDEDKMVVDGEGESVTGLSRKPPALN
jgi:hypothetical protein